MQFRRWADGKRAMLWSVGRNGVDEQGQGDDIVAMVSLEEAASSQPAQNAPAPPAQTLPGP